MTEKKPRAPAAFRLDAPDVAITDGTRPGGSGSRATIVVEPDRQPLPETLPTDGPSRRRGSRWPAVLGLSLVGLLLLQIGLSLDRLIEDLFARAGWLGWVGAALSAVAVAALIALIAREFSALARQRRITRLRDAATSAADADDAPAARRLVGELSALYADRPALTRARAHLAAHSRDIVDGRDLLILAERDLIGPIEREARAIVLDSARRVTMVTAISPRAVVDLLFVLYENIRLIRRLSDLYGGRPGFLGFWRLSASILSHLGVTGGLALGDGLAQQILGQGLVGRLSARLGEGVVNGLLTARIGLATLDLVRPLPRLTLPKPHLGDIVTELTRLGSDKSKAE